MSIPLQRSLLVRVILGFAAGASAAVGMRVCADGFGVPWWVGTEDPSVLQTRVHGLRPEQRLPDAAQVQYEIGFATFEEPGLGVLFDSLTISLARADGSGSTVLVTADVFGLTVAPLAPGGLLSGGGGIRVAEVMPAAGLPGGAAVAYAYRVEVALPAGLQDAELRTTFDFFNNGDSVASRGYALVAAVPEPGTWALLVLGTGWVLRTRRRSRMPPEQTGPGAGSGGPVEPGGAGC